jgi:hypothetical protein
MDAQPTPPAPAKGALIIAAPSDPASAAAFAAGNLFVFLCTPVGQKIALDFEAAGKTLGEAVRGLASDITNIFRGAL